MWRRGKLLSEHRSNEDNCAILSTDRTREDVVRNSNPLMEVRTRSFVAHETPEVKQIRMLSVCALFCMSVRLAELHLPMASAARQS